MLQPTGPLRYNGNLKACFRIYYLVSSAISLWLYQVGLCNFFALKRSSGLGITLMETKWQNCFSSDLLPDFILKSLQGTRSCLFHNLCIAAPETGNFRSWTVCYKIVHTGYTFGMEQLGVGSIWMTVWPHQGWIGRSWSSFSPLQSMQLVWISIYRLEFMKRKLARWYPPSVLTCESMSGNRGCCLSQVLCFYSGQIGYLHSNFPVCPVRLEKGLGESEITINLSLMCLMPRHFWLLAFPATFLLILQSCKNSPSCC